MKGERKEEGSRERRDKGGNTKIKLNKEKKRKTKYNEGRKIGK